MSAPNGEYQVTRVDQLEALSSPVRYEIAECLSMIGPASIGEVAKSLGRKPQTLYPHVRKLLAVDLLSEHSKRHTGRRLETLYAAAGHQFRFIYEPETPGNSKALAAAVSASLRRGIREFSASLEGGEVNTRGRSRDTRWMRRTGWVTRDELAKIHEHADAIAAIFDRARRPRKNAQLETLMLTLHPSPRRSSNLE